VCSGPVATGALSWPRPASRRAVLQVIGFWPVLDPACAGRSDRDAGIAAGKILRGDEARVGDRPNKGSRRWYKHIWADCYRRPVMYPGTLLFQDSRLLVSGRLTPRSRGRLGRDAGIAAGKDPRGDEARVVGGTRVPRLRV